MQQVCRSGWDQPAETCWFREPLRNGFGCSTRQSGKKGYIWDEIIWPQGVGGRVLTIFREANHPLAGWFEKRMRHGNARDLLICEVWWFRKGCPRERRKEPSPLKEWILKLAKGISYLLSGPSRPLPYLGPGPEWFFWEQRKQRQIISPPPPCSRSAAVGETSRRRPAVENHWEMGLVVLQDNRERKVISEMGLFDRATCPGRP